MAQRFNNNNSLHLFWFENWVVRILLWLEYFPTSKNNNNFQNSSNVPSLLMTFWIFHKFNDTDNRWSIFYQLCTAQKKKKVIERIWWEWQNNENWIVWNSKLSKWFITHTHTMVYAGVFFLWCDECHSIIEEMERK